MQIRELDKKCVLHYWLPMQLKTVKKNQRETFLSLKSLDDDEIQWQAVSRLQADKSLLSIVKVAHSIDLTIL